VFLASGLAAASAVWLAAIAAASGGLAGAWLGDATRTFASFVCHQNPDRSFFWDGAPIVVCARCLGLYVAAPLGALAARVAGVRPGVASPRGNVTLLALAAAPSLLTWLAERLADVPVTNLARFIAALPFGAAVAWVLVRTAIDARSSGISQYTLRDARRGETR